MSYIHVDLEPVLWVLGATAACILALRTADAYARRTAKERTRQVVDRALEHDDQAQ